MSRKPSNRTMQNRHIVDARSEERAVSRAPAGPRLERLPTLGEVASAASRRSPVAASPNGELGRKPSTGHRNAGGIVWQAAPGTPPAPNSPPALSTVSRRSRRCRSVGKGWRTGISAVYYRDTRAFVMVETVDIPNDMFVCRPHPAARCLATSAAPLGSLNSTVCRCHPPPDALRRTVVNPTAGSRLRA